MPAEGPMYDTGAGLTVDARAVVVLRRTEAAPAEEAV
jgi:hypothetical protein